MVEAFKPSPPISELQLPSENIMLQQGINDFNQALNLAATTEPSYILSAIDMVARSMFDAGIPPHKALNLLQDYTSRDQHYEGDKTLVTANVLAMLGDEAGMKQILAENDSAFLREWNIEPYLLASKAMAKRGEDPMGIVNEAMDTIAQIPDGDEPYWQQNEARALKYLRIATHLVEIGEDETEALQRVWEEKAKAPERFTNSIDIQTEKLICLYAEKGDYVHVQAMLSMVRQIPGSITYFAAKGAVISAYIIADKFENALNFAMSNEGMLYRVPEIFAQRAIRDAEQGVDVTHDVSDIMAMDITDSVDKYREIYPILGIALAKSDAMDQAREVFKMVEDAIYTDDIGIMEKAETYFVLAGATHDAGMDSDEIFKRAWSYYGEWIKDKEIASMTKALPSFGSVYEDAIASTIARNKFNLAREAISKEDNIAYWKALHMAELAKQEVMVARDSIAA